MAPAWCVARKYLIRSFKKTAQVFTRKSSQGWVMYSKIGPPCPQYRSILKSVICLNSFIGILGLTPYRGGVLYVSDTQWYWYFQLLDSSALKTPGSWWVSNWVFPRWNRVLGLYIIAYAWSLVNDRKFWGNPMKGRKIVGMASMVSLGRCIYHQGGSDVGLLYWAASIFSVPGRTLIIELMYCYWVRRTFK